MKYQPEGFISDDDEEDEPERLSLPEGFMSDDDEGESSIRDYGPPKPVIEKTPDVFSFSKAVEAAGNKISEFGDRNPRLKKFALGLVGMDEESDAAQAAYMKEKGITGIGGPDFMEISHKMAGGLLSQVPGMQGAGVGLSNVPEDINLRGSLAQKVTGSEGHGRLAAGALIQAGGDILSTGVDPRSVGIGTALRDPNIFDASFKVESAADEILSPVRELRPKMNEFQPPRRSVEKPYRMADDAAPPIKPTSTSIAKADELKNVVENTPNMTMDKIEDLAVREPFRSPFEKVEDSSLQRVEDLGPPAVMDAEYAPPGGEGELLAPNVHEPIPEISPYNAAREKFNMGLDKPVNVADEVPLFKDPIREAAPLTAPEPIVEPPIREPIRAIEPEMQQPQMGIPSPVEPEQPPIRPTARHIGTQPGIPADNFGPEILPQELYNVEGGPDHGTTVMAQGLTDRGIAIPENDLSLTGKSGDQIAAERKAAKAAVIAQAAPKAVNPFAKPTATETLPTVVPETLPIQQPTRAEGGSRGIESFNKPKFVDEAPDVKLGRIQRMLGVEKIQDATLKQLEDVYDITKGSVDPAERKAATLLKELIAQKKSTILTKKGHKAPFKEPIAAPVIREDKPQVRVEKGIDGINRVWINGVERTHDFSGGPTDKEVEDLYRRLSDPKSFERLEELKQEAADKEAAKPKSVGSGSSKQAEYQAYRKAAIEAEERPISFNEWEKESQSVESVVSKELNQKLSAIEDEQDPNNVRNNLKAAMNDKKDAYASEDDARIDEAEQVYNAAMARDKQINGKKGGEVPKDFIPDETEGPYFDRADDEPSFAKVKGGGLTVDADITRAAINITKDYSSPLSAIMSREGAQNGLDASDLMGKDGILRVRVNTTSSRSGVASIEMYDNGSGMTETLLGEKLTRLFASGKSDQAGATGGKGIGSASYILGGDNFEIETVAVDGNKKYRIIASGSPGQFLSKKGSNWSKEKVDKDTPTGTRIKVTLKADQDSYDSRRMMQNIIKHSRNRPSTIIYDPTGIMSVNTPINELKADKGGNDQGKPEQFKFKSTEDDKVVADYTFNNNEIKIQIPPFDESVKRSEVAVHYLNNGMYQFTDNVSVGAETKDIPEDVIVDIHPLVDELHDDYPFTNTREALKDVFRGNIRKEIGDNITAPAVNKKKSKTQEMYDSMTGINVPGASRNASIFDPGNRFTSNELSYINNSQTIKELIGFYDGLINNIIISTGRSEWEQRLEGIGLVFDQGMHGIHIPNPHTGKSTILINPFIRAESGMRPADNAWKSVNTNLHEVAHIGKEHGKAFTLSPEDAKDPRLGDFLSDYVNAIINHGDIGFYTNTGHQMDFVHRLGEVYAGFGVKNTFEAATELENIFTGDNPESGGYSDEFQELLRLYKTSRGRDETTEDFLSGTGVKQEDKGSKSKKPISGDNTSNGKGAVARDKDKTRAAVDKLMEAIEESRELQGVQSQTIRKERARRFAAFEKVKEEGEEGFFKSAGKLKGEMGEKEEISALRDAIGQEDVDTLFTAIKYANVTTGEKIRAGFGLAKILNGGKLPDMSELKVLDDVFSGGFTDNVILMHGGIGAVGLRLTKVANTMKALRSSFDLSGPLRQGIGLIHKPEYRHAFKEMFKYLADKEYFNAAMDAIEKDPLYLVAREAELFIARPGELQGSEEAFANSYIAGIPKATGIPAVVSASDRAYSGFLNTLRFDTFKSLTQLSKTWGNEIYTVEKGKDGESIITVSESTRSIARFINTATGRGHLGRLEKIAKELNAVLWSPKLLKSRFDVFNPNYYAKLDKFARHEAMKSAVAMATFGLTIAGLGTVASWMAPDEVKVSYNPLSSDFLKVRFKSGFVLDPWAGHQQIMVALARVIMAQTNVKPQTRAATIENFFSNKLSPAGSLIYEGAAAQKWTGASKPGSFNPFQMPEKGGFTTRYGQKKFASTEVAKSFAPMFGEDLASILSADSPFAEKLGLSISAGLGMGVQEYPEPNPNPGFKKMNLQQRKLSYR